MMKHLPLENYLEQLASEAPSPGGGAASAITGSQAAALLCMALNVSGLSHDERYQKELAALGLIQTQLLTLAQEDGEAFLKVLEAYKLPKSSEAEKAHRTSCIQNALKGAVRAPLATMEEVSKLYDHAEHIITATKDSVLSDVAIATLLMDAALRAANINVKINLKYIKDETFRDDIESLSQEFLRGKKRRRKILLEEIDSRLGLG